MPWRVREERPPVFCGSMDGATSRHPRQMRTAVPTSPSMHRRPCIAVPASPSRPPLCGQLCAESCVAGS